ncbi:condensation domain-containing protein [Streptomyces sp. NPDC102490]|uniref:condensation domain-containing protein n=1 Tax=Streptomyces sp. NPDC102490 TaxID=3366183 RepID=UPI003818D4E4
MPFNRSSVPGVTVVLDPGCRAPDTGTVLDLRGRLDTAVLRTALAQIAAGRPGPHGAPRLLRHGADHHTLELPAGLGDWATCPAGMLADLVTSGPAAVARSTGHGRAGAHPPGPPPARRPARTFPVTPFQRELLAGPHPPDQQVEQFTWRWHGPLDTGRFTAAWQCVVDRESVLRTAFAWDPQLRAVLFDHCVPEVVRHPYDASVSREALLAAERERGFDLRRPGLLRVALLDRAPDGPSVEPCAVDVALTYHRSVLDAWSVRLLLRTFYRAYLAGGRLPGGERRPDLRDYTRWLDDRNLDAARDFWRRPLCRPPVALRPAAPGERTGQDGTGRGGVRLSRAETARLTRWAARRGVTESSVLQAVWALVLYRASGTAGTPAPVVLGVTFSGRGVLLEDVERVPGPLAVPLPMSVAVDPAQTLSRLLRTVRDQVLGMAAYEWVPAGRIRDWLGLADRPGPGEVCLTFEHRTVEDGTLTGALAAHGVRAGPAALTGAPTSAALDVVAYRDERDGLVVSTVYDRATLGDAGARTMLDRCARLLRRLPGLADESTTVADVLGTLGEAGTPRLHTGPARGTRAGTLVPLRAPGTPDAATVCLVGAPGAPHDWHHGLLRCYEGAQALVLLRTAPHAVQQGAAALGPLAGAPGRLILGGFSGAGTPAYAIARRLAESGHSPPPVILGSGEEGAGAHALADALRRAAES